jgi:hypothetical protein
MLAVFRRSAAGVLEQGGLTNVERSPFCGASKIIAVRHIQLRRKTQSKDYENSGQTIVPIFFEIFNRRQDLRASQKWSQSFSRLSPRGER